MIQHPIGDHALLADGRTAALVDPDGNVAWLCWPRIDSAPVLMSLLDDEHGGCFVVRPSAPDAAVVARGYLDGTLVLRTVWRAGDALLHVDDALRWDTGPLLMRRLRAEGGSVDVDVRAAAARGAALPTLTAPSAPHHEHGTVVHRFTVQPEAGTIVTLGESAKAAPATVESTAAAWREMTAPALRAEPSDLAGMLDGSTRDTLLRTAAAVLIGLRQRGGGIVAAPTTSLPQWPGTARTWDYRYCWLRDASLAGIAMLRLGLVTDAGELAAFLGERAGAESPRPLVRVDGSDAPEERTLDALPGYRGARPVRIGNAAAAQLQLDVAGEVVELATALADRASLPPSLAGAIPRLASWVAAHWREPDHGIWEVRDTPRAYTHSRVMAWYAMAGAATLAERGVVRGDAAAWREVASVIRSETLGSQRGGRFTLHSATGAADAALSLIPLLGFAAADDPMVDSTLQRIETTLDRNGLLNRYEGEPDELGQPCAPFLFPTFWMASALHRCGRDGGDHLRAAVSARGSLGLFGEVALPDDGSPLGNYPQVQSHAACVLALTR